MVLLHGVGWCHGTVLQATPHGPGRGAAAAVPLSTTAPTNY